VRTGDREAGWRAPPCVPRAAGDRQHPCHPGVALQVGQRRGEGDAGGNDIAGEAVGGGAVGAESEHGSPRLRIDSDSQPPHRVLRIMADWPQQGGRGPRLGAQKGVVCSPATERISPHRTRPTARRAPELIAAVVDDSVVDDKVLTVPPAKPVEIEFYFPADLASLAMVRAPGGAGGPADRHDGGRGPGTSCAWC
jgi:hypothetical protein